MLNPRQTSKLGLLAAMVAAISGTASLMSVPTIKTRGQRGMRDIIGPATNWPSGKAHRKPRADTGQHPKFAKPRKHKQHVHPLRDDHGAFTLVGRSKVVSTTINADGDFTDWMQRRKWVAGISAQRGY